jgi:hypothetical protein
MPMLRKVVLIGGKARGVVLPSSWLACIEREMGHKLKEVKLEVDGNITIMHCRESPPGALRKLLGAKKGA